MCIEKHDCLKGVHPSLIPEKCYKCGFVAAELKAANRPVPQVCSKDLLNAFSAELKKRAEGLLADSIRMTSENRRIEVGFYITAGLVIGELHEAIEKMSI
jgi:hypothetical protein